MRPDKKSFWLYHSSHFDVKLSKWILTESKREKVRFTIELKLISTSNQPYLRWDPSRRGMPTAWFDSSFCRASSWSEVTSHNSTTVPENLAIHWNIEPYQNELLVHWLDEKIYHCPRWSSASTRRPITRSSKVKARPGMTRLSISVTIYPSLWSGRAYSRWSS